MNRGKDKRILSSFLSFRLPSPPHSPRGEESRAWLTWLMFDVVLGATFGSHLAQVHLPVQNLHLSRIQREGERDRRRERETHTHTHRYSSLVHTYVAHSERTLSWFQESHQILFRLAFCYESYVSQRKF